MTRILAIATFVAVLLGACAPSGPTASPDASTLPAQPSATPSLASPSPSDVVPSASPNASVDSWRRLDAGDPFDGLAIGPLIATAHRWLEFAQDRETGRPVLLVSTDGTRWQRRPGRTVFGGGPPFAVAASDGTLVALAWDVTPAQSRVAAWISTDEGDTWHIDPSTTGRFPVAYARIAGGPTGFVVYGGDGYASRAYVSPDGITWTEVADAERVLGHDWQFEDVAATSSGFLAVGGIDVGDEGGPAVWQTVDGLAWQRTDLAGFRLGRVLRTGPSPVIAESYGEDEAAVGAFVATGDPAWEPARVEGLVVGPGSYEFAHASGQSIAVADEPSPLLASTDGIHWSSAGPDGVVALRAAARGDTIMALMKEGTGVEAWATGSSATAKGGATPATGALPDLDPESPIATWQAVDASRLGSVVTDVRMTHVVASNGTLVATGSTPGTLWWSRDGRTWQRVSAQPAIAGAEIAVIAPTPTGFIAFPGPPEGRTSALLVSRDGRHWTRRPLPPAFRGAKVMGVAQGRNGRGLLAFGNVGGTEEGGGRPVVWSSGDGRSWRRIDLPRGDGTGYAAGAAVGADGRWVVTGGMVDADADGSEHPATWTSTDGVTWERHDGAIGDGSVPWQIVATPYGFLGTGGWDGPFQLQQSADGVEWSAVEGDFGLEPEFDAALAYGNGVIVVGAHRRLNSDAPAAWWSADGTHWQEVDSASLAVVDAEAPGGALIADAVVTADGVVAVGMARPGLTSGRHPPERPAIWLAGPEGAALPSRVCSPRPTVADLVAMTPGDRVGCYGRRTLRLRGYLANHGADGECPGGPGDRLGVCRIVGLVTGSTVDPWYAYAPIVRIDPTSIAPAVRGGWVEVAGHFDDQALASCLAAPPTDLASEAAPQESLIACREQFTVTSLRRAR